MSLREIALRVRTLQPAESRLTRQVTAQGITIINDAYSANPVGIVHALRVLSLHQTGRRLLITPGMVELGDLMASENRRLGEIAAQHATDVILVGAQQTAPIKAGLLGCRIPRRSPASGRLRWRSRSRGTGKICIPAIPSCSSTICLTPMRPESRIESTKSCNLGLMREQK